MDVHWVGTSTPSIDCLSVGNEDKKKSIEPGSSNLSLGGVCGEGVEISFKTSECENEKHN